MSDVTLSRSDLFLVLFAAIALARMVSAIARSTVTMYMLHRAQARIVKTMASGADMMANLSQAARQADTAPHGRVNVYDRDTLDEVRVIQEGAFLAGWRSAEQCRNLKPESEEHAMHHFRWRDIAGITENCARAGSGASNALHPSGVICSRPAGHEGQLHNHGALHWTDEQARAGQSGGE